MPNLVQAVGAQLELLAQAPQHGRLLLVGVVGKGAGNVVRALALLAVVDEVVLAQDRADAGQGLG
ncbi:MAG TPA: hypothetical protein VG013_05060, partial [Gemmataceae bacterium]|nr:hypothetical protein [Gemmataceae bacterium]